MKPLPAQNIIHIMFAFCLCTCIAAIVFVLCWRVIQDGNDQMSQAIATNLMQLGVFAIIGLLGVFGITKIGTTQQVQSPSDDRTPQSSSSPPSPV